MKTVTAYYCLLLYTLVIFKSIIPIVQDEFAHVFWKAKHLATVHYHHGDYHVPEEIAEADQEENHQQPTPIKTYEPVSVHIVVEDVQNILQLNMTKEQFAPDIFNTSLISLAKHYPPPKLC